MVEILNNEWEKNAFWKQCKAKNRPFVSISRKSLNYFDVEYDFFTVDYSKEELKELNVNIAFEPIPAPHLSEKGTDKIQEVFENFIDKQATKYPKHRKRFDYYCGSVSGRINKIYLEHAKYLAGQIELVLKQDENLEENRFVKSDFFCRNWSESQKEIYNKIQELKKQKGNEKDIALLNNLLKQPNDSKGLHLIIKEASKQENFELSSYRIEKLSQAVIEGIQDYFKDVFKEQEQQESKLREYIKEGMKRFREWQRWSEKEINDLIYLWKVKCKKPNEIGRLMQRSSGSIERMIDFIECDKYLNSKNFYKKIETKFVLEEKKHEFQRIND